MTTAQEPHVWLTSQAQITACTGCGRTVDQVVLGARCRTDRDHRWWTGSRQDWDDRQHYVFGGRFSVPAGTNERG